MFRLFDSGFKFSLFADLMRISLFEEIETLRLFSLKFLAFTKYETVVRSTIESTFINILSGNS